MTNPDGTITREWYRFFLAIQKKIGGTDDPFAEAAFANSRPVPPQGDGEDVPALRLSFIPEFEPPFDPPLAQRLAVVGAVLDDALGTIPIIENGTWSPALTFNAASTGITYGLQSGVYTKIGDIIHVSVQVTLTAKGSSTGLLRLTGLPYTAKSSIGEQGLHSSAQDITGPTTIQALVFAGETTISFRDALVNATTSLADTHATNTTKLRVFGTYLSD